ncbi:hypothetical protein MMC13_002195 [Lambiella insularis]|nr:hypothetical protein [Lambiella insularis]
MATLAPYQSSTRQPFSSLDGARLRNLTNVKNRQNALPVTLASPVKRRYSPSFDDVDSENVDPLNLSSQNKKAKSNENYPVKVAKTSHYVLKSAASTPGVQSRPMITPRRLDASRPSTRKATAPSSAPAAAGRSPKSKRIGILSRHRRINPPSYGLLNGPPFSIDAALSGTVSSYKPEPVQVITLPTLEDSVPKTWLFDIHEDTIGDVVNNVVSFTAKTLDISDDEGRRAEKNDRGKENVPPPDYPSSSVAPTVGSARPVSRNDMMTDEARTPLGSLDAVEFYAEGCDTSSFIIVPGEKSDDVDEKCCKWPAVEDLASIAPQHKTLAPQDSRDGWKDLLEQIETTKKANAAAPALQEPAADIEIWESESAKGDEDAGVQHAFESPLESTSIGMEAVELENERDSDCKSLIL